MIKHIRRIILLVPFCSSFVLNAQNLDGTKGDTIKTTTSDISAVVEQGLKSEKVWRSTGATFSVTGKELERMTSGNLLNTLQGRIPGLTVMTGSGEPGYDNPTLYGRGLSSWNVKGNSLIIILDGFQVSLDNIAPLSANEIESVTYLKDASNLAIYGMQGGSGALIIKTYRGIESAKPIITANARYGLESIIDKPTVMNAFDYTTLYNQARTNDGLSPVYTDPSLYQGAGDYAHPNVNWYDAVLKPTSDIKDVNFTFRGGDRKAKYFVLMDYANFNGMYKNADEINKDFGTNATYNKYNLRGNVDINITKSFSVSAQISGIIEDNNTPSGFTADNLFNNLMSIPASAFSIKNPNGTWGNNPVYNFNPVMLLKTNGIYNAHTRNLQTNFGFNEKLDAIVRGLSFNGAISFSNIYYGTTNKNFTVLSYALKKDGTDNAILDVNGNPTYTTMGSISNSINEDLSNFGNRTTMQLGLNYDQTFGKNNFTGFLLAQRRSYSYKDLTYQIREQGLSFGLTYDYDKKYIVDLSGSYFGSADFEKGSQYGLFPAVGLGWIVANEGNTFLKIRGSYGLTGNTNNSYRFLYDTLTGTDGVWKLTTSNSDNTGRQESSIPNTDFTWEKKTTLNLGFDANLFKKLSVNFDVFTEDRTGILDDISGSLPDYTNFRVARINSGEVRNRGFEAIIGFNDKIGSFSYYIKGMTSFARNKILKKSQAPQQFSWLLDQGYRIDQQRGLVYDRLYQTSDFDSNGKLLSGIVSSDYAQVRPGDIKFKDQNNDGVINDLDIVPIDYSSLPEVTFGVNLGFKFKGFDFDAFVQGVTNRTVVLPTAYTDPFVLGNNNITAFSANAWTEATAATATRPRLTTLYNDNNYHGSDFYMRDGSFIKLRSIELGYTFKLKGSTNFRLFVNGTNLFTWDKIDDLEAERLSNGYLLVKTVSLGLKANF